MLGARTLLMCLKILGFDLQAQSFALKSSGVAREGSAPFQILDPPNATRRTGSRGHWSPTTRINAVRRGFFESPRADLM